jgi:glutamyl-tRNA synthetase
MVPDTLRGKVCVQCSALDDMVLLRSDGKPTYILASAVDDHDADITHVIRGDEHLTNSARQSLIYRAMGWTMPVLTHIPMVCDADGNKLSKRSGAQSIAGLRDAGYLPEAVLNAALRTGWARGDDEVVPVKRALEIFELGGLNKSAARFDGAKLDYLNAVYMRQHADLWSIVQPMLVGWSEHECRRARILLPEVAKRSSTLVEILGGLAYCRDDFCGGAGGMDGLCDALRSADFSAEGIEVALRRFATNSGIGMREVAQSIRVAITGSDVSPSLFFMLSALGRDLVLKRLCKE